MLKSVACAMGRITRRKYKGQLEQLLSPCRRQTKVDGCLRVLDVGAGNCWLLSLVSAEHMRVGIDLSRHLHGISDSWVDPKGAAGLHFVIGDGTRLPFSDGTFDLVYSNEYVSHVSSIDATILEQIRVLKKGALLVAMDANILHPITFVDLFLVNYMRSLKSRTRRGGMQWLLHREEMAQYFELAGALKGWRDENIHGCSWWRKKLRAHSHRAEFTVSTFSSYLPDSLNSPIANKILILGKKT
jgi:ubiquinone/menaquinone biosynthesis C-methylase UbiE